MGAVLAPENAKIGCMPRKMKMPSGVRISDTLLPLGMVMSTVPATTTIAMSETALQATTRNVTPAATLPLRSAIPGAAGAQLLAAVGIIRPAQPAAPPPL